MLKISDLIELDEHESLPINWGSTMEFSISFKGFGEFSFIDFDQSIKSNILIITDSINSLIYQYKDTHLFGEPYFSVTSDGILTAKISLRQKDLEDVAPSGGFNE